MRKGVTFRPLAWLGLVLLVGAPLAVPAIPVLSREKELEANAARSSLSASPRGLVPYDPYILSVIEAEGEAEFFVVLKVQADLSAAAGLYTKAARGQYVFDALSEVAGSTQGPILQALGAERATFQPFWIRNMVRVRGDKSLLLEMAARPDVAEIVYEYPAVPDVDVQVAGEAEPDTLEWNIERVNADDVWALGITGEGAVVAGLDSGVQWEHPALINSYRPQIPGAPTRHDYNWWDGPSGSPEPTDYGSYGTHTMGTIVGDDGAGNQIGMAPGAKWIACAGLGNHATPTDCFQFLLAPTKLDGSDPRPDLAPDVIGSSWSSPTDYHAIIQTLHAAGIFLSNPAGDGGGSCATIKNPGQWPEVTAAAAFAQGDVIRFKSSRGPVIIDHNEIVKPDLAAPGVLVRSSIPLNSYQSKSGTGVAAAHIAGAVALVISANPELAGQADALQKILKESAEPKLDAQCEPYVDNPNNVWGWGILNAYDAVIAAQEIGLGDIEGTVYDSVTLDPVPDALITFENSDGWQFHAASAANGSYGRTLPADTYGLTAVGYGYLPGSALGVVVEEGSSTSQDLYLDPAPVWVVSGSVTETIAGSPLAATIAFEGTQVIVETDRETGYYAADVVEGTYWMTVSSPGQGKSERQVIVGGNQTQDFALEPIHSYYLGSSTDPCDPVEFSWLDATGGADVCIGDDASQNVPLPEGRTFTFYGSDYSSVWVGSNGHVTFGEGWNWWAGPIPDPAEPNNGIYAFSTDLNPYYCNYGEIFTDYFDDRYFVVEYKDVQHHASADPETFEIILDLDTGAVAVQFLTVSDPSDALVAVENADGTEASQYALGDPDLIHDGVRVEFYPAFGTPPGVGAGELKGMVSDVGSGVPIEGATVMAVAGSNGDTFAFSTGPEGAYSGLLCADAYTVSAAAEGYHPGGEFDVEILPGAATTQDLQLARIEADLWIGKAMPETVEPGAKMVHTLSYGSVGPDDVPSARVYDPLDMKVDFVSSTYGTYDSEHHAVVIDLSSVVSGFTETADIVTQVKPGVTGLVCNIADIGALGEDAPADPDLDNNTASDCTTIAVPPPEHTLYLPLITRSYAP